MIPEIQQLEIGLKPLFFFPQDKITQQLDLQIRRFYQLKDNQPLTEDMRKTVIEVFNTEKISEEDFPSHLKSVLTNLDKTSKRKTILNYLFNSFFDNEQLINLSDNFFSTRSLTITPVEIENLLSQSNLDLTNKTVIIDRLKRLTTYSQLVNELSLIQAESFFSILQAINQSQSNKDLDMIRRDIRIFFQKVQTLEINQEYQLYIETALKKKCQQLLNQHAQPSAAKSTIDTIKTLSEEIKNRFEQAMTYFQEITGQSKTKFVLPKAIMQLAMILRKHLPVANTEVLSYLWWQLRLGGTRAEYILNWLERCFPDLYIRNHLSHYKKHLFDHLLTAETSSFEFKRRVSINNYDNPDQLLTVIIENFIKYHIPEDQNVLRFTLLDEEKRLRKLIIPYSLNMTSDQIKTNIASALENSHWQEITFAEIRAQNLSQLDTQTFPIYLSEDDRAQLSYLGNQPLKREANPNYKKIYQYQEEHDGKKVFVNGDYLIQIGAPYKSSRDPRSLFAADNHQIALQIRFDLAGKPLIIGRFNHQYFDGQPALIHFQRLVANIENFSSETEDKDQPISITNNSFENYQLANVNNKNQLATTFPLTESEYSLEIELPTDFDFKEGDFSGKKLGFFTRLALKLAKKNNVSRIQQLFAGKRFITENPNFDNIQPVALTIDKTEELIETINQAIDRAKQGLSDVALFAAISGTYEIPLSWVGQFLNSELVKILKHSQGMISPLVSNDPDIFFTTAFSDSYLPEKIDLNNPEPHIGIIGINSIKIDERFKIKLTVRLLPAQAQYHFRDAIIDQLKKQTNNETLSYQTPLVRQVLTVFNKILKDWNKLTGGSRDYINFDTYLKTRAKVLEQLKKLGVFQDFSEEDLQIFLNQELQNAAKNILSAINQ